ncbi:MAG: dihydroorotase [Alphaproteobacteria bacterium]|jgi:dihydroorotase
MDKIIIQNNRGAFMDYDLILKNGTVSTISGQIQTDIGIKDQKIVSLGDLSNATAVTIKDCHNLHVLPGVIDTQAHMREPGNEHKDDLYHASQSAVLGGVTSVFEMPNTSPSTTTADALNDKLARGKNMFTDHAFYVGATADNISELATLEKMQGCAGIKIFMGSSTGNLLVSDDATLEKVLRSGTRRIAIHAEDEYRLIERKHIAEEIAHPSAHPQWRDVTSALLATKRIVAIAEKTGRKIHILHISTGDEVDYLAQHKSFITCEVLVNHLTLAAPECYEKYGTLAQMNPPIRTQDHQDKLWEGVRSGVFDIIATDHAPHTVEEKQKPYPQTPSGIAGIASFVPLMLNHVNNGKLTLSHFVDMVCHAPARVFGLCNKGFIRVGYDADFTIVNMNETYQLTADMMRYKAAISPFEGHTLKGKVKATIIRGHIVVDNYVIQSEPFGKPLAFNV